MQAFAHIQAHTPTHTHTHKHTHTHARDTCMYPHLRIEPLRFGGSGVLNTHTPCRFPAGTTAHSQTQAVAPTCSYAVHRALQMHAGIHESLQL